MCLAEKDKQQSSPAIQEAQRDMLRFRLVSM